MEKKTNKFSWFDTSVFGSEVSTRNSNMSLKPTPLVSGSKRKREDDRTVVGKRRLVGKDLWIDKYKPLSSKLLAVQPKKVEEVRNWFETHNHGILLLTGPTGCGKTATVYCLAEELNLDIHEWENPIDLVEFGEYNRAILESVYIPEDKFEFESQKDLFLKWLRGAKYKDIACGGDKNKVILLEEFPSFALQDPARFQNLLLGYSRLTFNPPLVLICSETGVESRECILKTIFKPEFLATSGIDTINLNAVTSTNLSKVITRIVSDEQKKGFQPPDKQTLDLLCETSGGDIRSAINSLQFSAHLGSDSLLAVFSTISRETQPKKTAAKSKGRKKAAGKSDTDVGQKDQRLDMFRGLGKILYAKKEENSGSDVSKPSGFLEVGEDVFEKMNMSEDAFTAFLHQNFPLFYTSVHDVSLLSDYFSECDLLLQDWGTSGKMDLKDYAVSLASRAVMCCNKNPAKVVGMRKLTKPDLYAVNRTNQKNRTMLESAVQGMRLGGGGWKELVTTTVPLLARIQPKSIPAHHLNTIVDIGRIRGVTRTSIMPVEVVNNNVVEKTLAGNKQRSAEEEFMSEDDEIFLQLLSNSSLNSDMEDLDNYIQDYSDEDS